jgi:hypothetical protein
MNYVCARCGVEHHADLAVLEVEGKVLCRNTMQCSRRLGPNYSIAKAIRLSVEGKVNRKKMSLGSRIIYENESGILFSIGIKPPKIPTDTTWLKYKIQKYIRTPKILWVGTKDVEVTILNK